MTTFLLAVFGTLAVHVLSGAIIAAKKLTDLENPSNEL
jgi:hypothetical protein